MGLEPTNTEWERPDWLLEARALLKTIAVASEKHRTVTDTSCLTRAGQTGRREASLWLILQPEITSQQLLSFCRK